MKAMRLLAFFVAIVTITGCNEVSHSVDVGSESGESIQGKPGGGNGGGSSADPKLAFIQYIQSTDTYHLYVTNLDGSHKTSVYSTADRPMNPSWSTGGSLVFDLFANSTRTIQAIDVSVNSSGVPVGSNQRTVFTASNPSNFFRPRWSSTTSTDKIAFVLREANSLYWRVCMINADGTNLDTLCAFDSTRMVEAVSWNYNDSKLAIQTRNGNYSDNWVYIYTFSSNAVTDSVDLGDNTGNGGRVKFVDIDWSRGTTPNKLVSFVGKSFYYVTPTTGSTPASYQVINKSSYDDIFSRPGWSADNNYVYWVRITPSNSCSLRRTTAQGTNTSTIVSDFGIAEGLDVRK